MDDDGSGEIFDHGAQTVAWVVLSALSVLAALVGVGLVALVLLAK